MLTRCFWFPFCLPYVFFFKGFFFVGMGQESKPAGLRYVLFHVLGDMQSPTKPLQINKVFFCFSLIICISSGLVKKQHTNSTLIQLCSKSNLCHLYMIIQFLFNSKSLLSLCRPCLSLSYVVKRALLEALG